ncbi:tRNA lysidine(34) synthetase TilS [Kovacikia minuta CCNUW1]|uniref:tRNA lysidine(34) synthetase TilS n=1 Tax=Kovacikia minuta TaxID=2931930 RepID=UPI001CCBCC39|nr:tRNA lysidine(34) synthetase TilS [Kovacikia minuta]UBF27016.1 tRNA lysidine(34) synthetase TilS [Kovacikia minuta CCNUW1]
MPWTSLHAHLHQTLKQRRLLEPGRRVLVAVSGGQDSVCLLKLLLDLQPKWGWQLAIAHCDHCWETDIGIADFVHNLAHTWKLPFHLQTAAQVNPTEAGAREWRYQALSEIARQHAYSHVATGHTASDRAETLLYNLVRGSGADGLQALTWRRSLLADVVLIRPLLAVTRSETAQFCQDMQLQIWEDAANQNLKYARNRIRQELLPYLKTHFNPKTEQALAQTAELLQADVDYLETEAAVLLQRLRHPDQPGFNRSLLRQAPLALQRRVIRQWLKSEIACAPNFEQIEKVVALLAAPNRSQTDPFPGGAIAHVETDWIWLKY